MGSFAGHIDEGIVLTAVALWWLYNICKEYFKCQEYGKPYESKLSYTVTVGTRKVPVEIFLKIGFPIIAFVAEVVLDVADYDDVGEDRNTHHQSNMQHMTIFFLFIVHGVSDLIDYLQLTSMKDIKYLTGVLAFAWYGVAFYFHSDPSTEKNPLELIVHRLPVGIIFIAACFGLVEIFKRDSVVIQLVRTYSVLTMGTWLTQITFILFQPTPFPGTNANPNWDQDSMSNTHFMITAFGIHLIVNAMVIMAAFYITEAYVKCLKTLYRVRGQTSSEYGKVKLIGGNESEMDEFNV